MEQSVATIAESAQEEDVLIGRWLAQFERALKEGSPEQLGALFADECHWRDLLAFTWNITPFEGREKIVESLLSAQSEIGAFDFKVADKRTAPRSVTRIGTPVVEGIFSFETKTGRGYGIVRLPASNPDKAWVLMTSLQELKGHEPLVNDRRPSGAEYSRQFGSLNWAERREKEQAFEDREPAVLIVGAGQTGLSTAARLRVIGVDVLCVEQLPRVGDQWRRRYHSLALHNQVALNQMAYLPFPPSWPKYLSKDMLAGWIENYAWAMECNVWTSTTFVGGEYDEENGFWLARVRRADGTERTLRPRHLIFANGIVGAPTRPRLPGLDEFKGTVMHTHDYREGFSWKGKDALVVGAGTSGHDIAQDLFSCGARVKMVQRDPIAVTSLESACLTYTTYYDDGLPTEDCDLLAVSASYPLAVRNAKALTKRQKEMDKELLDGLQARGFKLDFEDDETGYMMKVRRTHGGYYLNCGCSDLIVSGDVGLIQSEEIDRFVADGALLKNGTVVKADLIVTATGYQNQKEVVRELLGTEVAEKVGSIWGIDHDGELKNMYRPTAQKGLWFLGSGLSQARIYSHYVALQVKARELGIV